MKLYDEEIEKCVLGCMVLNESVIPNITANISETDFYLDSHREGFTKQLLNWMQKKKA